MRVDDEVLDLLGRESVTIPEASETIDETSSTERARRRDIRRKKKQEKRAIREKTLALRKRQRALQRRKDTADRVFAERRSRRGDDVDADVDVDVVDVKTTRYDTWRGFPLPLRSTASEVDTFAEILEKHIASLTPEQARASPLCARMRHAAHEALELTNEMDAL
mmetsp:Transcript_37512/g.72232  ORF Transcript_37512/g.72232 Transcript_37512/m.72232 type:complete len:165 (+) Transcript_37512:2-496(+)